ncbi:T9SS type A sorting domain-containing protein [candidate division KSB1 bacterium]|nr:T9SS type A sorting domain-containing protein [candidate division KSB1 bacterium]
MLLLCSSPGFAQNRLPLWEFEKPRNISFQDNLKKLAAPSSLRHPYDVHFYRIQLSIDPSNKTFQGEIQIKLKMTQSASTELVFDVYENLSITNVDLNSQSIPFTQNRTELIIPVSGLFNNNDDISITIEYDGKPANIGGFSSIQFAEHANIPVISTLSEPFGAPLWWPCNDDPADKADSVDIIVTVPQPLTVASNGILADVVANDNTTRTFFWKERNPISTYLVSLAISDYAVWHDQFNYNNNTMDIVYYAYPDQEQAARIDFSITDDLLKYYSDLFGTYPFINEKYGMAVFPWGGAMEHQTCTSLGASLITGKHTYDWIIAHELAHQWFGDYVTMRHWSHIWLNEGFATYAEALWAEHLGGIEYYQNYMQQLDDGYFPVSIFVIDSTNASSLFSSTVYHKGAWVLHMLRRVMSEPLFFNALNQYLKTFAFSNATTEDLQQVCEQFYHGSLDWFFKQWIYGSYRPKYEYSWKDNNNSYIEVELKQLQSGQIFKMPVDIQITTAQFDTTFTIWDSLEIQIYQFPITNAVKSVNIDPENWILKYLHLNTIPEEISLLQNYPNPFNNGTEIPYKIHRTGNVNITIFNINGQEIKTLINQKQFKGNYKLSWDGKNNNKELVAAGVYMCQLTVDEDIHQTIKIVKLN